MHVTKFAKQAERCDEMADYMDKVGQIGKEPLVEERNLLLDMYMNTIDSRCIAWRVAPSVQMKKMSKSNEESTKRVREHYPRVEVELMEIWDVIVDHPDSEFIGETLTGESEVFHQEMKANYYHHIAEFTDGNTKNKAAGNTRAAHAEAEATMERKTCR